MSIMDANLQEEMAREEVRVKHGAAALHIQDALASCQSALDATRAALRTSATSPTVNALVLEVAEDALEDALLSLEQEMRHALAGRAAW